MCSGDNSRRDIVEQYIKQNRDKKIMIFTETKEEANRFGALGFANFLPLHGDLNQGQRQNALRRFKQPDCRDILVATDVAARGLDVNDIDVIIQYRVRHVDSFVHRTGRTGRAGKTGMNLILCGKSELPFLKQVEHSLKMQIEYRNTVDKTELNLDKVTDRIIKKSEHSNANKFLAPQIEQLTAHYQNLDEGKQLSFLQNVLSGFIL